MAKFSSLMGRYQSNFQSCSQCAWAGEKAEFQYWIIYIYSYIYVNTANQIRREEI